jgi:hypothetical protein
MSVRGEDLKRTDNYYYLFKGIENNNDKGLRLKVSHYGLQFYKNKTYLTIKTPLLKSLISDNFYKIIA